MGCRSVWNELDHNLSDSILDKLEKTFNEYMDEEGGLRAILSSRLVSKAWKAAEAEYSGKIVVEPQSQREMHSLIKTLPNITELHVNSKSAECMEPVSAFNRLSSLSYSEGASWEERMPLDLSLLPASLLELSLNFCRINPSSFQNLRSTDLTSLRLNETKALPTETCQLFPYLPLLQELSVSDQEAFFFPEESDYDLSHYLRISSLTELALDGGILLHSPRPPIIATALQRLYLRYVDTDAELLRGVCNELPSLTELEIYACTDGGNTMRTISGPATGLRSLHLVAVEPMFIQLAGPHLLSLKCQPDVGERDQKVPKKTVSAICSSTSLTKLTLCGYHRTTRFSALQGLKLQELVLHGCPKAAHNILSNGAMSTLEKLQIRDRPKDMTHDVTAFNASLRNTASPDHKKAQKLHKLGQILLSLPRLVEVSGACQLFSVAMAEDLRAWSEWKTKDARGVDHWVWKKLT